MDSAFTLARSILVIFVPGIVAVAPWLLLATTSHPQLADLYSKYPLPYHAAAFTLVVVVGALMEGCMTYLEKRWDEKEGKTDKPARTDNWLDNDWYDYLSHTFGDKEPVAYRYLSRKVTELYFYMTMTLAAPLNIAGFVALLATHGVNWLMLILVGFFAAFSVYMFLVLASDTHCVLYDTRHVVMKRIRGS